jgi:glycosyltransferase involved in cell wall biosynthesis
VTSQTLKELEIIIIDDGSTDGTGEISDRLAELDSRIHVIHQCNGGLSVARNTGLDAATGEWIAFLDSDDWVEPEMYATLLHISKEYDACLVSCKSRNVNELGASMITHDTSEISDISLEEIVEDLATRKQVRFEVWNKLWRKDLIGNLRFIPGQVCEDVFWNRNLLLKSKRVVHIDKTLHNYLVSRPGNTNSTYKSAKIAAVDEFILFAGDLEAIGLVKQSKTIACIGTDFTISLFISAMRTNQSIYRLCEIKKRYAILKKRAKGCRHINRKAIILFDFSPSLYNYILMKKEQRARRRSKL